MIEGPDHLPSNKISPEKEHRVGQMHSSSLLGIPFYIRWDDQFSNFINTQKYQFVYLFIIKVLWVLFFWFISGKITSMIARKKGRDAVVWFFIGFFLGPLGIAISLMLSKNNKSRADQ